MSVSGATLDGLIRAARSVLHRAHAPYSMFHVGAALRTRSGRTFVGVNVECASYGLSMCAERNAIAAAVGAGEREFECIVIATATARATPPCGACRQLLAEFAGDLDIVMIGRGKKTKTRLSRLLPAAFRAGNLAAASVPNYSERRRKMK